MSPESRALLLHWIGVIVYVQVIMVIILSFLTLLLLSYRKVRELVLHRLGEKHGEKIVEELISCMEGQPTALIHRPGFAGGWNRIALREKVLDQIRSVSGNEKQFLIERYEELGFIAEDLMACASALWWRRLDATSRLATLGSPRMAGVFHKLKNDKNELVSMMGLLGLSELKSKFNQPDPAALMPLLEQGRYSTMVEITANWCKIHGLSTILEMATSQTNMALREALIRALLTIKTPESSSEFVRLLYENEVCSPAMTAQVIRALQEIGDPAALPVMQFHLLHADPIVRQRALEFVLRAGSEPPEELMKLLTRDRSTGVRRLIDEWKLGRVA